MIHDTAIIHASAQIGKNVEIGPFTIVEDHVVIGDGCKIESHVRIGSHTVLGENNHIFHGSAIGIVPQDLGYQGEETGLVIGNDNIFREYVTLSKGTVKGGGKTQIGDSNFFMNYVHIGHDSRIGNHVILTNSVQVAGHVEIDDFVTVGGLTGIHQFCKIGKLSMIGGASSITQDVVPFALADGHRANVHGLNLVGLRRNGCSNADIRIIKEIYRHLFHENLKLSQSIEIIGAMPSSSFRDDMLSFLKRANRGIMRMERDSSL